MDSVHFFVGSPGYLYIQEPYANADTGGDDWGPLSAATFNSTTWILATVSTTRHKYSFVTQKSNDFPDPCLLVVERSGQ